MNDPGLDIRLATHADADFIRSGSARLAENSHLDWLPPEATDRFAAAGCESAVAAIGHPEQLVLIAEAAGKRLGFLHATLDESAFTGERVGYISTVVVMATAARQGIGRLLIDRTEEWARDRGCDLITLEVFAGNRTARAVYERLGYQEQTLKLARRL